MMAPGVALLLGMAAGCGDKPGSSSADPARREEARADSTRLEQKALQDSGVSVDTQRIDTGTVHGESVPDN